MKAIKCVFGKMIKRLRKEQGMSQRKLAEESELHVNTIHLLERGDIEAKISTLFFLAKGLNFTLGELMTLFAKTYKQ